MAVLLMIFLAGCAGSRPEDRTAEYQYPRLHQVMANLEHGQQQTIAYLGGSITWGATSTDPLKTSWRALVTAALEARFPQAHIKAVDAAIGGQGSELAVFRMDRDVLPYRPDLTFVEFAVNDHGYPLGQEAMEGIIRKLRHSNPEMAIVPVLVGSGRNYGSDKIVPYRELAAYYHLPCIDICSEIQTRLKNRIFKVDDILSDGTHPNDFGYHLYAGIVQRELLALSKTTGPAGVQPVKPLTANRFGKAGMIELAKLPKLGSWQTAAPDVVGVWFDHQPSRWLNSIITPSAPDATLMLPLKCSGAGLYYETLPDGGTAELAADGRKLLEIRSHSPFHFAGLNHAFKFIGGGDRSTMHQLQLTAQHSKKIKIGYLLYTE